MEKERGTIEILSQLRGLEPCQPVKIKGGGSFRGDMCSVFL